jgi:hypothetical protein
VCSIALRTLLFSAGTVHRGEWLLHVVMYFPKDKKTRSITVSLTPSEAAAEIDSIPSTKWCCKKFEIDSHVLTVSLPLMLPSFLLQRSFG